MKAPQKRILRKYNMDEQRKARLLGRIAGSNVETRADLEKLVNLFGDKFMDIAEDEQYYVPYFRRRVNIILSTGGDCESILRILKLKDIIHSQIKVGSHDEVCSSAGGGDGHSFDDFPANVPVDDYDFAYRKEERERARQELKRYKKSPNKGIRRLARKYLRGLGWMGFLDKWW